jgi:hypothetical protein
MNISFKIPYWSHAAQKSAAELTDAEMDGFVSAKISDPQKLVERLPRKTVK